MEKELTTSDLGVASFDFTPSDKKVEWTVRATDMEGQVARRQVSWEPGTTTGDFLFRADKVVYAGGDTVHMTVQGGGNEPVFVDLLKDGQTFTTAVIPLVKGWGEHNLDLPSDLFGTIEVRAPIAWEPRG